MAAALVEPGEIVRVVRQPIESNSLMVQDLLSCLK